MPHAAAGRQIDGIEQSIFSRSATAPIPRPSSSSFHSCRLGGPSMLFSRRVDSLPFWPYQFLIDPKLHKSRRELANRLSAARIRRDLSRHAGRIFRSAGVGGGEGVPTV